MSVAELINVLLTVVIGLITSVAAVYQVIDIRRRSREDGRPASVTLSTAHTEPVVHARLPVTVDSTPPWTAGPPVEPVGLPRTVARARKLMLVLTVLSVVAIALLFYSSAEFDPGGQLSNTQVAVGGILAGLIVALPLTAILTALSVALGRARNWARIASLVVMATLALGCCFSGGMISIAGMTTVPEDVHERSAFATVTLGLTGIAIAGVALAGCISLLAPAAHTYFARLGAVALSDHQDR